MGQTFPLANATRIWDEPRLPPPESAVRIPQNLWYSLSTYYFGDLHLERGIPHGYGTIMWANGDRFYGYFDLGDIIGRGTFTNVNGERFENIAPTWLLMNSDAIIA